MSTLKADALQGKTSAGDITVTSEGGAATMQLQQGLAKAWVNLNQTGTQTINDSLNTSSITDNSVGSTTYSFASNMSSANYSANATSQATNYWPSWVSSYGSHTMTSSQYAHQGWDYTGNYRDFNNLSSAAHGDLA